MRELRFLLDNQWVSSSENRHFTVYNPANGQKAAFVADAAVSDVEAAVDAACRASAAWAARPVQERCAFLLKAAELLEHRLSEVAASETE